VRGTLNLLVAARDARVKRVVYASSSAVYGDTPTLPKTEDVGGQVFNIACGQRYNLLELVATINRILGMAITPVHTVPRVGDVRHSLADIVRAREMLGYRVEVRFEEGLRRTIEWFRRDCQS
jgi:nucleoside-diphosphate-sugar epimerase